MTREHILSGFSFRLRDRHVRTFGDAELESELSDGEVFSWIDLQSLDLEPLQKLLDRMGVDRRVTERLQAPEVLPWIVERPNCVAFRLYEIDHAEAYLDTRSGLRRMEASRLLLVLGKDFILTWHEHPLDVVNEVRGSCADAFRLAGKTPGFVAFLFLQRCLYDYAELNLANDNFLDDLEHARGRRGVERRSEDIETAGHNILTLKKLATSLQIVCMLFATKRSQFVSDEARVAFRDLQDNAVSVRAAVDDSRDLLNGILGGLQAEAANRTSEVAGVLTAVSVIMLPLGLVAGLWGMNFDVIPMAHTAGGFWILLGLMAAIAAALIWAFRKRGWIGPRQ